MKLLVYKIKLSLTYWLKRFLFLCFFWFLFLTSGFTTIFKSPSFVFWQLVLEYKYKADIGLLEVDRARHCYASNSVPLCVKAKSPLCIWADTVTYICRTGNLWLTFTVMNGAVCSFITVILYTIPPNCERGTHWPRPPNCNSAPNSFWTLNQA